jgi:hypothetical protein
MSAAKPAFPSIPTSCCIGSTQEMPPGNKPPGMGAASLGNRTRPRELAGPNEFYSNAVGKLGRRRANLGAGARYGRRRRETGDVRTHLKVPRY